jgi:arylsulfatase A-like enzyme
VAPKKGWLNRIMTDEIPLDEGDLQHLDALYDAAVMGSDRFAGELLDGLAARGLVDSSVIVFLADHGEDLYDHNQYIYHACSVYQSGLHVPLAFVAPGLLEEGAVVRQGVELMDVTPTVLDLVGVTLPDALHGTSLVPYLESTQHAGSGRPVFSEYGSSRMHTVQLGDWKLVDNPDHDSPYCLPGAPEGHYPLAKTELYNLADDPLETTNLADQYPQKVAELQELIRRRFADLPSRLDTQEIPEDLIEELEALGYVAN